MTPNETFSFDAFGTVDIDPRVALAAAKFPMSARYEDCIFQDPDTDQISLISNYRRENGLVLCFSKEFDPSMAARFRRHFCVKIPQWRALKAALYAQIGQLSQAGACTYVAHNQQRSPFIKGNVDAWQKEFRLYWPDIRAEAHVNLPPGLAEEAACFVPRSRLTRCPCGSGIRYKHCHGRR